MGEEIEKGCRNVEEEGRGEGRGENKKVKIWGFGKWEQKSGKGVVGVSMHFDTYRDQSLLSQTFFFCVCRRRSASCPFNTRP